MAILKTQELSGMLNLDTHVLIDIMVGHLSSKEERFVQKNSWCISDIVLWELYKLNQLKRIKMDFSDRSIKEFFNSLTIYPINLEVLEAMSKLDFKSDPADEIIAATSLAYQIPLFTRDEKLLKSKVLPLAKLR